MTIHTIPAVLELRGVRKTRRDSERVFEVVLPELVLPAGSRIALLGESGSGKSTLLALLALASRPDGVEEFRFGGADVAAAWARGDQAALARMRAGSIAYLPQRDGLLDFLSVRQNIRCSAELAGALPLGDLGAIMRALRLDDLLDASPALLSGGQRQRVAVACALVRRPRMILADEPTAALDHDNAHRVIDSLCDLSAELGAAIVFATHQPHLLERHGFDLLQASLSIGPDGPVSTFWRG